MDKLLYVIKESTIICTIGLFISGWPRAYVEYSDLEEMVGMIRENIHTKDSIKPGKRPVCSMYVTYHICY